MSKLVAIIGGGPTGFATARALLGEAFRVRIYERQSQPGGVWVYTGEGPVYRDLDTNIFKELMEYHGRPFPAEVPRYATRQQVWEYVDKYSRDVAANKLAEVRWNTEVKGLAKEGARWRISFQGAEKQKETDEFADYVVVASGHYDIPSYPAIQGLREYAETNPGCVLHSRHYNEPGPFRGKKVLVIGNGSSGVDITIQLLSVTAPLTVSRHKEAASDSVFKEGNDVIWKPEATNISSSGEVTFSDGSKDRFDALLIATGYLYRLPFLETEASGQAGKDLVDPKGLRVRNLHKYMFYIKDPTIAFVALNKQIVPMPFAESQSAAIARVWSHRLQLPSLQDMEEEEQRLVDEKGSGSGYFQMGFPVDVEYIRMLCDWVNSAGPEGFHAERWGKEKAEMRSVIAKEKLGEYARKRDESVAKREQNN